MLMTIGQGMIKIPTHTHHHARTHLRRHIFRLGDDSHPNGHIDGREHTHTHTPGQKVRAMGPRPRTAHTGLDTNAGATPKPRHQEGHGQDTRAAPGHRPGHRRHTNRDSNGATGGTPGPQLGHRLGHRSGPSQGRESGARHETRNTTSRWADPQRTHSPHLRPMRQRRPLAFRWRQARLAVSQVRSGASTGQSPSPGAR